VSKILKMALVRVESFFLGVSHKVTKNRVFYADLKNAETKRSVKKLMFAFIPTAQE
jgi:hypothetical protein